MGDRQSTETASGRYLECSCQAFSELEQVWQHIMSSDEHYRGCTTEAHQYDLGHIHICFYE